MATPDEVDREELARSPGLHLEARLRRLERLERRSKRRPDELEYEIERLKRVVVYLGGRNG